MALSVAAITLLAAAYSSQVEWISWAVLLLVAMAWLSEPWHRHGTVVSLAFAGFTALVAVAALNTFSPILLL